MKPSFTVLTLLAGLSLSGAAQAALIDRGGGMIFDNDRNITWLADANYARTSNYDADGRMTWQNAMDWAANLVYGGYDDWRLPTTLQPDATCGSQSGGVSFGYNCTGSEMGHLFYTEGGLSAGQSILESTILNNYFINMQSDVYWSGLEYAPYTGDAWLFPTVDGGQRANYKDVDGYAWAVRPGDVAAAVPEPATLLLLGLGLAGLGVMRRRRG